MTTIHSRSYLLAQTIIQKGGPDIWVVRFTQPDIRDQLRDDADIRDCPLFRKLHDAILAPLHPGQPLILNLALVEFFPVALYRFLLHVREAVTARGGRFVLCRLSPEHLEVFQLFQTFNLFTITATEADALREVGAAAGMGNAMLRTGAG